MIDLSNKGGVEFEVRGQRDASYGIGVTLYDAVLAGYYKGMEHQDLETEVRDKLSRLIEHISCNVDMSNWYLPTGGGKVTKPMKKYIRDSLHLNKKEMTAGWSVFCEHVRQMYMPTFGVRAWFMSYDEMQDIGNGVFERGSTCFGKSGENEHHKRWAAEQSRIQAVAVSKLTKKDGTPYALGQEPTGRCYLYFRGGRTITLFNYYYGSDTPQNDSLFVEARVWS